MDRPLKKATERKIWSLREKLHDNVRQHGTKNVAREMDKNPKTLANEVNEYNNKQKLDWGDLLLYMDRMQDLTILDGIEQMFGRIAIKLDQFSKNIDENTLFDNLTDCLCQLGGLGKKIKKARHVDSDQGKEISTRELDEIEKQAFDLIRTILSVLAQLEPDSNRLESI